MTNLAHDAKHVNHSISHGSEKKLRIIASRLEAPFIEAGTTLSKTAELESNR